MPPSYSPCPRPCLKRNSNPSPSSPPQDEPSTLLAIDPSILSPLVRFPPHTSLAHTLGSAAAYDRSPIVVLPNRCALPERGCPGRTYAADESVAAHIRKSQRHSLSPTRGKHLHPRAAPDHDPRHHDDDPTPRQSPRVDYHPLPPLVPDLSSSESSEESDGIASPPPEFYHSPLLAYVSPTVTTAASLHPKMSLEHSLMNLTLAGTNAPSTSALSFLPHPPSPRVRAHHSPATSPVHSPSSSISYGQSNPPSHHFRPSTSPVRSRSPSSPTHRRKPRPAPSASSAPMPIPAASSYMPPAPQYAYPSHPSIPQSSPSMGAPASPERERERRSRHRDDPAPRSPRERSRERREKERAEKLARFRSARAGFGVEDNGCLGGF